MTKVFVAQPAYDSGSFERHSFEAPEHVADHFDEIAKLAYESSLLANGFNRGLAICLNDGGYDEFCLLHGDVVPKPVDLWLKILVDERDAHGLDVIHAPCAIKDGRGLTSTAIAYSDDPWETKRRLTTSELHELPATFTIDHVRARIDPLAAALLPNTGCLLFSARAAWLDEFPGFAILDRLDRLDDGTRVARVVPEDWHFGYWAAARGLVVGATRLVTPRHIGKVPFMTEVAWGSDRVDEQFFRELGDKRAGA